MHAYRQPGAGSRHCIPNVALTGRIDQRSQGVGRPHAAVSTGNASQSGTGIAALAEALSSDLSFLGNAKYADAVASSQAGAILVPVAFAGKPSAGQAFLRVDNPSYALALLCSVLEARLWPRPPAGIHASAIVAASACGVAASSRAPASAWCSSSPRTSCLPENKNSESAAATF